MIIASEIEVHGPVPSGSGTFQVRVIVVPVSDDAGVYVAFAVFLFDEKVPLPPVQLPPLAVFAASRTGAIPQTNWSAPALAVAGAETKIATSSEEAEQGPPPSGSGIVQVNVTVVPNSDTAGV
jgi:hypothetical protein